MTVGNANDDFDDELLSAYVDGELTAAERALVEERLRSEPAAAALVEELRVLSSTIKSLPRQTLGRDLRAGVLAEVEQVRADLDRHGPATLPMTPVDRWAGIRRGLVWSALAIAATVLIAAFQPAEVEQKRRDLARAEKREAEVESLKRPERRLSAIGDANNEASADKHAEETLAADAEALPPGLRGAMSSGGGDGSNAAEEKEKAMAAASASAPAPEAAAPLLAEAAPAETPMLDAAEQETMTAGVSAGEPIDAATSKDALADRRQATGGAVTLQDSPAPPQSAAAGPLAMSQPSGAAAGTSGAPMAMGGRGALGPRGGAAFGYGGEAKSVEEAREGGQAILPPQATVTLKLASTDGAKRFEQLLAESDIAPADDAAGKKELAGMQGDQFAHSRAFGRPSVDAQQGADRKEDRSLYFFSSELKPQLADAAENRKLGVELERSRGANQPAGSLVWVEATPAQIDALLAKCRNEKEAFAAVVADEELTLAKRAESAERGVKLKQFAREEQAATASESKVAASEKRERILFVLEPATPALQPAAPAAAGAATGEAK